MKRRALIGCEFSARIRDAMRRRGIDAYSCDLLPSEGDARFHIQGDVREVMRDRWSLAVFHPTCRRLTNSGVRWLAERNLWADLDRDAEFFSVLLNVPHIPRVAIENPIPHRYAVERIGRTYDQCVQPRFFGDAELKATCFWLRNLPPLRPTNVIPKSDCRRSVHHASPGPDRWKNRSRTFPGMAEAIAEQWGGLL
jgi:hypothetical protein